jgi:hypothetical protein
VSSGGFLEVKAALFRRALAKQQALDLQQPCLRMKGGQSVGQLSSATLQ